MQTKQYQYLPLLAMLYIMLGAVHIHNVAKYGNFHSLNLSIDLCTAVFWFLLGDIFAEVYGYQLAMKLFWCYVIIRVIFTAGINILILLPLDVNPTIKNAYLNVFAHSFLVTVLKLALMFIAFRINTKLIIKWRILTQGKHFWLRSLGASAVGESIFYILSIPIVVNTTHTSYSQELNLTLSGCVHRIILTALLAIPCIFIANFLKHIEKVGRINNTINFPVLSLNQIRS